ncbi:MAG: twin-arginine translocase subunit TatC [Bacteroidota bacterium]|jgi:sec-independent protein translocase protein TatC
MPIDQLDEQEETKEMSFFDHIDELRKHIIRSVLAIVVFSVVAFANKHILFDVILFGPKNPDFWTYRMFCKLSLLLTGTEDYCVKEIGFILSNISITGQFSQHFFISFIAGCILAFPFILWQFWQFIKPALSAKEKGYARGLVFYSSVLFFTGILFGYYLLSPVSVSFMGSYRVSDEVINEINLESYISFVATLTFATGLVFELPILVYFLAKIGLLTSGWMRKYRRYAIVVILILAALVTPPDVSSQVLLTIPLLGLYELSIWVASRVERNERATRA